MAISTHEFTLPQPAIATIEQPERVYRLDSKGHRFYYTKDVNGNPTFYISVTSLVNATSPPGYGLIQTWKTYGHQADRHMRERQHYGTFLHIQLGELMAAGVYDLDALRDRVEMFIHDESAHDADPVQWTEDAANDILAFIAFVQDYEITPIAMEIILTSRQGYAGAIDLICEMNDKRYTAKTPPEQRARVHGIVDMKSGRKGFWDAHALQLHGYKQLVEENYPDINVEALLNWAPTNWVKEPNYKTKPQLESAAGRRWPYKVGDWMAQDEDDRQPSDVIEMFGRARLDGNLSENYVVTPAHDAARSFETEADLDKSK